MSDKGNATEWVLRLAEASLLAFALWIGSVSFDMAGDLKSIVAKLDEHSKRFIEQSVSVRDLRGYTDQRFRECKHRIEREFDDQRSDITRLRDQCDRDITRLRDQCDRDNRFLNAVPVN